MLYPASWDRYRVKRNLVVSFVRKAKINYDTNTNQSLSDPAISTKKWWRIVKSTYGNKCYSAVPAIFEVDVFISDSKEKVNVLNDYFVRRLIYQIITLLKFHFSLGCHGLRVYYHCR